MCCHRWKHIDQKIIFLKKCKNFDLRQIDRGPHCGVRGSFLSALGRFPGSFRGILGSNRPFFVKKWQHIPWHASFCSNEGNLDEFDPGHMVFFITFDRNREIGWFQVRSASFFTENTIRIVSTPQYGPELEKYNFFFRKFWERLFFAKFEPGGSLSRQIISGGAFREVMWPGSRNLLKTNARFPHVFSFFSQNNPDYIF